MSERRILKNKLRRQQEMRKNFLLLILTICFVCSIAFTTGSFLSKAKSSSEQTQYKYYTSISIEKGDTLWSIAADKMGTHYDSVDDYVSEVKQMNALQNDDIKEGMYLVVPYYSNVFIQ